MILKLKNFFLDDFFSFKKEDKLDQVILLVYSFFPVFLIIGTAASEIGIIFLFFFSLYFFYLNKINIFKNSLTYGLIFIYFALLINLFFSENFSNSFLRNFFFVKYIIFTLGTISFFSKKKISNFFCI